jgi:hypothetical protein
VPAKGGSVSVGGGGRPTVGITVRLEGFQQASDELKAARRDANARIRAAVESAANRAVLPAIKDEFPKHGWASSRERGLPSGAMAASLYVKRDRTTVLIGSKLRGSLNRALGWIDFGGKRPNDTVRRTGPHVIVNALQSKRAYIDEQILSELLKSFAGFETIK